MADNSKLQTERAGEWEYVSDEDPGDKKPGETKKNDEHLAGNIATLGNSFIAFVGAGILDLPYAFSKVGLYMGTAVMVVVAFICLHCMFLLVDCKLFLEKTGKPVSGYGDVGYHAYGWFGAKLVDVSLVITQFGFCTAYLILISNNLHSIMVDSPSSIPYIWLCVPGEILLSMLRHLKYLGKFSIVADISMAFTLSTIFYFCFKEINSWETEKQRVLSDESHIPYFFGVCIYCYEGIGMVIPIQSAMRHKDQFKLIWGLNILLVTILFWGIGYAGYKAYGVTVRESIASNLPAFDMLTAMVQISVSTGLYFTFPVMMFPVYQILEQAMSSRGYQGNVELRQNIMRICVIVGAASVATLVPSFSNFIVLVGSSTCALLAFIFPALFSLKLRGYRPVAVVREGTVVVLGLIAAYLGTMDALDKLRNAH
eukprot:TRINITY_DN2025_c4_g1_i1.p1 TRINITY_DN2025_c4_g1~~TRINITY_DN2025_c4_g1_i1.p1  ORF type:complete len:426 (+),score=39.56 TRINITY_DN2025_c4_g1_i1:79-1356(+)